MSKIAESGLGQALVERGRTPARSGCPASAELVDALGGELPPARRGRLADHLIECPDCAAEYRTLREAHLHELRTAAPARAPRPRWWPEGWRLRLAVAAAAAAGVAALVLPWAIPSAPAPSPSPATPPSLRGPAFGVEPLTPRGALLPRERFVLRWRVVPGARYVVHVSSAELGPVLDASALRRAELTVPPDRLASIPSGGRVLWTVIALLPDGRRLTSRTLVNRVK